MNNKKTDSNPWSKNQQIKNRKNNDNVFRNSPAPSEMKFNEAHGKLQAAVQKHVKDYESSSDEEELESEDIIDGILKNYTETGGKGECLGRTRTFLQDSILSGTVTCLICISRVRRDSAIWSCFECYCVFHLSCIQRWSKDSPCPPCPVTVSVSCYCGSQQPKTQRCNNKEWSCGNRCGKLLACQKHTCSDPCHFGDCHPCSKKSLQKCLCKNNQKLRDCATPTWKCDKVCNKLLECGNHTCLVVCHEEDCDPCPLTQLRTCPCGKSKYQLSCTEETPTCLDTCDKILKCGIHKCNQRCHKEACGVCLETVEKSCKCGLHSKEVHCYKPYFCETKCKRMKDCNKHPCNKK
ncbi:NF-X1-type zinc finger protein NFXL1, partial [Asbolus verrucosus]